MDLKSPTTPVHPAANEEVRSLPTLPLPAETMNNIDLNPELYDDDDDEVAENEDGKPEVTTFTVPFEDALRLLQLQFNNSTTVTTESQQSKLINYIDDNLLQIHRKFIKNITNFDNNQPYTLEQLVTDLSKVVDLIWFSISHKNRLFGQQNYFITILTDLEDFVSHYSLTDIPGHVLGKVFTLFQSLDTKLSFLIDGYDVNGKLEKVITTDLVRMVPIVMRLRIEVITKVEGNGPKEWLDVEVSRLFEGIIERSET